MHRTTLYLPDDLHRKLRLLAYETRSTISDLLRAAAEKQYRDLLEKVSIPNPGGREPSPSLLALTENLRADRFRRDRRFR